MTTFLNQRMLKCMLWYAQLSISVITASYVLGQTNGEIKVSTKIKHDTKGVFFKLTQPFGRTISVDNYKGYPKCDTFNIYIKITDLAQYKLSRNVTGDSAFVAWRKEFGNELDTFDIYKKPINNYIAIFSGILGNYKYLIVDENNDHDFSNDRNFRYDINNMKKKFIADTLELTPLFVGSYESYNGKKIIGNQIWFRVMPYNSAYGYKNKIQELLTVYNVNNEYREGYFTWEKNSYKISVINKPSRKIDSYQDFYYKIQKIGLDYPVSPVYDKGDSSYVDNHLFEVSSCSESGDSVYIRHIGYFENPIGGFTGFVLPKVQGNDAENSPVNIEKYLLEGKYVMIDFWGSWCAPCLRSMPTLKNLSTITNSRKLQFISVDHEFNELGRNKAIGYIKKEGFDWPQIIELPSKGVEVSKLLTVKDYPTFILINPAGKVVARETGENSLIRIEQHLKRFGLLK